MRIKPFKATYPNFDFIASPDTFCENAKFSFEEFRKNGFFEQSKKEALYIYQIQTMTRKHTGLITLSDVHDFFDGKIKKHEKTISEKEQQQMEFFMRWNAILKPVLLTYDAIAGINAYLEAYAQNNAPLIETKFEKDGQIHRVWEVSAVEDIAYLTDLFDQKVNSTYIADGHHRTTTVALLYERLKDKKTDLDFDNLFCAYFAADQLDILDYNRVVEGLKEVSITNLMVRLSKLFDLEVLPKAIKPTQKHEIILYIRKEWFRLKWKPEVLKQQQNAKILLDASLLNELVFRDIFGIHDVRNDTRITYIEGAKGLEGVRKASNDNNDRMGFALYPVSFSDLMRMVDAGESLPPKSTYFEPRLRSGLLVKLLKN
jgi:uncharacterized protein (DUF1015 family)